MVYRYLWLFILIVKIMDAFSNVVITYPRTLIA
jgi:hypothetical protein